MQAGQTVASLVPSMSDRGTNAAELQAQLFAPSRTAGFVERGHVVYLRYSAFPYQKFGMSKGFVEAVSRSPIAPQDLPAGQGQALLAAAQANEPMYRITVKLPSQTINTYRHQTTLSAGMSIDADVRQDARNIWEWLLEPALAVAASTRNLSDETKSKPGG